MPPQVGNSGAEQYYFVKQYTQNPLKCFSFSEKRHFKLTLKEWIIAMK